MKINYYTMYITYSSIDVHDGYNIILKFYNTMQFQAVSVQGKCVGRLIVGRILSEQIQLLSLQVE